MAPRNIILARHAYLLGVLALVVCATAVPQQAQAEQTWGYVAGWFSTATCADSESCPNGLNPGGKELDRPNLLALGYTPEQAHRQILGGKSGS